MVPSAGLSDVARIDWAFVEALCSPHARSLTVDDLVSVRPEDWATLRLPLHPATRTFWFETPAMPIWLAHREDGFDTLDVAWAGAGALIVRPEGAVEGRQVCAVSFCLADRIRRGDSVGAAATLALERHPDRNVGAAFAALVRAGTFAVNVSQRDESS